MRRRIEPMVVGRIVGDVVDIFKPEVEISIHYGNKQLTNGCHFNPSLTHHHPILQISPFSSSSSHLFTLVMVDPDAPSPSEPTLRELLHWMVVDIPQGNDASKGKEITEYMGPKPATGIHRYVFVLFRQEKGSGEGWVVEAPGCRSKFSTRRFAQQNRLKSPVAAAYFNSQKETSIFKR